MRYHIELSTQARKELLDLPKDVIERLAETLDDLEENPRPPASKKLTGREGYRIRKGNYRILYTIDDKQRLVRVYRIGHRREIYRYNSKKRQRLS